MKNSEVITSLLTLIDKKEELFNCQINSSCLVKKTYVNCLEYCFQVNEAEDTQKKFEIESLLDYLQDELNTGHWSEIPVDIRRAFTACCFVKSIIVLKDGTILNVELLQSCLVSLDMGLLLGAPLKDNHQLLSESARFVTELINKMVCPVNKVEGSEENLTLRCISSKRKIHEDDLSKFVSLKGKEIEAVECPSLEYFNNRYFTPQKPVKLTGCITHWPASTKWLDVNYLLSVAGDRTVPIEIGSHYVDENWSQKLMKLKDFIRKHYLSDSSKNLGYLAQHNLFEQITELKEDIRIPEYCCLSLDYNNSLEPDVNAWLGPKGTVSPLHHDPKNNLLAQVYGTKQMVLFAPQDTRFLYPHEDTLLSNTAQVNPIQPDLEKHPEFTKSSMFTCLLEPGEMLFIPVKWWHHVTALDKSFSVSFWWQ